MNEIEFLRTCMTTVIIDIKTKNVVENIFEIVPIGKYVFEDTTILAKYYKNKNGKICTEGECPVHVKCFPKTITFYCKGERTFKIRWFYSKSVTKLHLASGLKQELAVKYVTTLATYISKKIIGSEIGSVQRILVNGMAQAKFGVNLYKLAKLLKDDSNITFVYTPDQHAALKIYTKTGTVCVHSTGKILYMGPKNTEALMNLHSMIAKMGQKWDGVPILLGI